MDRSKSKLFIPIPNLQDIILSECTVCILETVYHLSVYSRSPDRTAVTQAQIQLSARTALVKTSNGFCSILYSQTRTPSQRRPYNLNISGLVFIYSPSIFQSQGLYVPTTVRIISTDSRQYPEMLDDKRINMN